MSEVLRDLGARRVVVVSARPPDWVPDTGVETLSIPFRDGEQDKNLGAVEALCAEFARFGLTRSDAVAACGGGTTTDVVGLAAALYHRGVPVVHLPTTLLAQVDASVGGKTAVNLPSGKNLIGAYWQPAAVLCDTDYLSTLPPRELRNGYGEIARCHFIGSPNLLGLPLERQIVAGVTLKANIVAADERDTGIRHRLNFGHTLGHALELTTGFAMRHGEGVAVGTVFAGLLAGALGRIGPARVAEHREVVESYGLPVALPAEVSVAELITAMKRDKKSVSGLAFTLDGPDGVDLIQDISEDLVSDTLARMPRSS
ncbi:3-dehydroquinate synthase family protein [Nocardia bovistercoris]|uniref:3-dehydroquinate synthase n=1 Tax=Nocardia bovistercoris TaxID=2785916 RepID=A0A931IHD3_9NOCA|nr:3-dehydroquinate synthase family protein [Nocardia bovistercoris]MBH0779658.1 3-dehydroquinate synthase [Nocardia bovistercoris]